MRVTRRDVALRWGRLTHLPQVVRHDGGELCAQLRKLGVHIGGEEAGEVVQLQLNLCGAGAK